MLGAQYNPKVIRTLKLKQLSLPYKWYSYLHNSVFQILVKWCIQLTHLSTLICAIKMPSQVG